MIRHTHFSSERYFICLKLNSKVKFSVYSSFDLIKSYLFVPQTNFMGGSNILSRKRTTIFLACVFFFPSAIFPRSVENSLHQNALWLEMPAEACWVLKSTLLNSIAMFRLANCNIGAVHLGDLIVSFRAARYHGDMWLQLSLLCMGNMIRFTAIGISLLEFDLKEAVQGHAIKIDQRDGFNLRRRLTAPLGLKPVNVIEKYSIWF